MRPWHWSIVSHGLQYFENCTVSFSLRCSFSTEFALLDPNITDLLQGERPKILAAIGLGCGKSGFRRTNISEMVRDSSKVTSFQWVTKSTTLDDLEGSLYTLFQNVCHGVFVFSFTVSLLIEHRKNALHNTFLFDGTAALINLDNKTRPRAFWVVPRRQPQRRSALATLPCVGAIP